MRSMREQLDFALNIDPNNVEILLSRAEVKRKEGDRDGALQDIQKAIHLAPRSPSGYFARAIWNGEYGCFEEAISDLNTLLETSPTEMWLVSAIGMRGVYHYSLGRYEDAVSDVDSVSHLMLNYGAQCASAGTANRGKALLKLGLIEEAIAEFSKSIGFEPTDPISHEYLAIALMLSGQLDLVNKELGILKQSSPDYALFPFLSLIFQNKPIEATRMGDELLQKATTNGQVKTFVRTTLSLLLSTYPIADIRNGQRAFTLIEEAWTSQCLFDWQRYAIASPAYAECGNFMRAVEFQEKALAEGPESFRTMLNRMLESYQHHSPCHFYPSLIYHQLCLF